MLFPSFFNASAGGYEIEQSLRFDGGAQLTRTVGNNGGSRSFTFSVWLKKSRQGDTNFTMLKSMASDDSEWAYFNFGESSGDADQITCRSKTSSGYVFSTSPARKYRDPSSWMHLVLKVDKSANTATGYVNGEQVGGTAGAGGWTFNKDVTGDNLHLGQNLDGYLAEAVFVDNQALNPDSFGEYDNNNVWRPINVSGLTFGTNGWYLTFDPTATNGIGHDHSGNGNHWTPSGFSTGTVDYAATGADPSSKILGGSYQDFWDGNTSTGIVIGQGAYVQMTSTSLPVATSTVGFYTGNGASTAYLRINGTEEFSATSTTIQWWDFSFSGAINKVEIGYLGGSGSSNTFSAFRIDGTTIVGTPGKDLDVLSDTPTTNWCTLNPLAVRPSYIPTFSEGNLKVTHRSGTGQYSHCGSTIAFDSNDSSGYYCEVQNGAQSYGGVSLIVADYGVHNLHPDVSNGFSTNTNGGIGYDSNGYIRNFGTTIDYTSSYSYNSGSDILGIAVKDNKVWFSINGSWIASGNPSTGANPVITLSSTQTFVVGSYGQGSRTFIKNFGQRAFAYTPPTGFKALNTSNLPAPTVKDGSKNFNAVAYSGNSSTQSINVGFQPGFLWLKSRTQGYSHWLVDSIRGTHAKLSSDSTSAENTDTTKNPIKQFTSTGFDLQYTADDGLTYSDVNASGQNFIAWNWLAGNGTSSNTDGSITSTVSANPTAGFSIVSYTGNGTAGATVGHGLGVAPDLILPKVRSRSGDSWHCYHSALGGTKGILLNAANAAATDSGYWNNTNPSSTVFTVGTYNTFSSQTYIAYCFAEVEGYSKFGSYTGNGSTDGPFVYCGFKPAMVIYKNASTTSDWTIVDSARSSYNEVDIILDPSNTATEGDFGTTNRNIDFLSNGFKIRSTAAGGTTALNGNSNTMVFMAFAENPFGGEGVSPATAR